jgi:hypothetical protein
VPKPQIYRLKVTLRDVRPPIWRRIEVPGMATLGELHAILQTVMGWHDSHLHEFEIDGVDYGRPDDGWGADEKIRDESRVRLNRVAGPGTKIRYTYDFGDNWRHDVVVEKMSPAEDGVRYPRCLAGKRAIPPEDVGGDYGYAEFCAAMADPGHPEHEHYRQWIGRDWDPEFFQVSSVNEALQPHQWQRHRRPPATAARRSDARLRSAAHPRRAGSGVSSRRWTSQGGP